MAEVTQQADIPPKCCTGLNKEGYDGPIMQLEWKRNTH
jgi:hypothetical protein